MFTIRALLEEKRCNLAQETCVINNEITLSDMNKQIFDLGVRLAAKNLLDEILDFEDQQTFGALIMRYCSNKTTQETSFNQMLHLLRNTVIESSGAAAAVSATTQSDDKKSLKTPMEARKFIENCVSDDDPRFDLQFWRSIDALGDADRIFF